MGKSMYSNSCLEMGGLCRAYRKGRRGEVNRRYVPVSTYAADGVLPPTMVLKRRGCQTPWAEQGVTGLSGVFEHGSRTKAVERED